MLIDGQSGVKGGKKYNRMNSKLLPNHLQSVHGFLSAWLDEADKGVRCTVTPQNTDGSVGYHEGRLSMSEEEKEHLVTYSRRVTHHLRYLVNETRTVTGGHTNEKCTLLGKDKRTPVCMCTLN